MVQISKISPGPPDVPERETRFRVNMGPNELHRRPSVHMHPLTHQGDPICQQGLCQWIKDLKIRPCWIIHVGPKFNDKCLCNSQEKTQEPRGEGSVQYRLELYSCQEADHLWCQQPGGLRAGRCSLEPPENPPGFQISGFQKMSEQICIV